MKKALLLLTVLLVCITGCALAAESTYTGTVAPFTVNAAGEHTLILNGVTIKATNTPAISLQAPAAKVTVILKDGTINTLSGGYMLDSFGYERGFAGLSGNGVELVIRCESAGAGHTCTDRCGKLVASGYKYAAGIGGDYRKHYESNITIEGGNITATGGKQAPGIGAGNMGILYGDVNIRGGNVNAAAGPDYAPGIGSYDTLYGNISITGGNVHATGSHSAPGIGSGDYKSVKGNITLSNCTVTATGGSAGIGSSSHGDVTGTITITNSIVNAKSSGQGPGIGAGLEGDLSGRIIITNSTIDAAGGDYAAGIGTSSNGTLSGSISISGSSVTAAGGRYAAGIGLGSGIAHGMTGSITITDTAVNATGGEIAPGIGSGAHMDGDITLSGVSGTITGGAFASGIGCMENYELNGSITLIDPNFTVTGGAGKQNNQTVYPPAIGGTIGQDASVLVNTPTDETLIYAGIDQNNAELVEGSPFSGRTDLMDVLNGQPYVRFEHIVAEVPVEATTPVPQTGDPMNPALLCLLMAGAAIVAVLAGKKKEA